MSNKEDPKCAISANILDWGMHYFAAASDDFAKTWLDLIIRMSCVSLQCIDYVYR